MTANRDNLIWIDLEMTGLNPDTDTILEIATLVTDSQLNILAQGPEMAITQSLQRLESMDDWNRNQHRGSGLWQRSLEQGVSLEHAEAATIEFLREWVPAGASPICGNSICQDRRFLARHMPALNAYFHYRQIDVSSLKELARRWAPNLLEGVVKRNAHTALSDIEDSINELRHYRQFLGAFAAD